MPRIARMVIEDEPAIYHVTVRTALDEYPFGDVEKDEFFNVVKRLSRIYFTDVLGICMIGDHFHLLVRMWPATHFSDAGIIGSREFVKKYYHRFRHVFVSKNEKIPKRIAGLKDVYSMKRLSE